MLERLSYVMLSERVVPEETGYSGFCDELGLATFSSTPKNVSRRLSSVVMSVLNAATQREEIDAYLKGLNVPIHELPVDMNTIVLVKKQPDPVTGSYWVASSSALILGVKHVPYIYFPIPSPQ